MYWIPNIKLSFREVKAYMSRGIAPLILIGVLDGIELSTSRPGRFTAGKEGREPLNKSLGGHKSRFERF
jgi:hypothetical protein